MACCKCCCGNVDCAEGDQGKCCCGGVDGTCCSESQYCCNGACQSDPCGCPYSVTVETVDCYPLAFTYVLPPAGDDVPNNAASASSGFIVNSELDRFENWQVGFTRAENVYPYLPPFNKSPICLTPGVLEDCVVYVVRQAQFPTDHPNQLSYYELWEYQSQGSTYGAPVSLGRFVAAGYDDPACQPPTVTTNQNPLP